MNEDALTFLSQQHPYEALPADVLQALVGKIDKISVAQGDQIYEHGARLAGLYVIQSGLVSVRDATDTQVSLLERGNSFGERGLMADGLAVTSARAVKDTLLICLPPEIFAELRKTQPAFTRFFARSGKHADAIVPAQTTLAQATVDTLMVRDPVTCAPDTTVIDAARLMSERRISCLCIVQTRG